MSHVSARIAMRDESLSWIDRGSKGGKVSKGMPKLQPASTQSGPVRLSIASCYPWWTCR